MSQRDARPKWWQLYLTFPLLILLFMADHRLQVSPGGHEAVQIGILALVYGFIYAWLNANSAALSRLDRKQYHGTIKVTRIEVYGLHEPNEGRSPMFDLPHSELKGLLGTEFEREPLDTELLPIDEALQESRKG